MGLPAFDRLQTRYHNRTWQIFPRQNKCRTFAEFHVSWSSRIVREVRVDMPKTAHTDAFSLIRIGTFTAELERLHLWGTDEEIDREFNSVCRSIWGYTLDDFDDDCLSKEDHAWLDELIARQAYRYAAQKGYDLGDYANGEIVSDWWGFVWMILAEDRGLLTLEQRALAWQKHDERLLERENIVAVIRINGLGG
jgi:hypothetical protein